MQKFFTLLLSLTVIVSCYSEQNKETNPTSEPVKENKDGGPECDELLKMFHTVYLGKDKSIQLQKDISSLDGITNKISSNFYSIKKGSFGVADSMAVEVNSDNKIIAITAAYEYEPEFSNDTAYIHELHKYQKLLCKKGKEYEGKNTGASFKVTKWEAGNIIFDLVEVNKGGKKKCYSVIFDRDLYFKKLKPIIDLNGKDISIELYNRIGWEKLK